MLEASGGSGPPKARVLWAPIGTGGVNRRAVSLRSLFAHEPRVVFRDNKRATSSSAGTTTSESFGLSHSLSLSSLSSSPSYDRVLLLLVSFVSPAIIFGCILRIFSNLSSFLGLISFRYLRSKKPRSRLCRKFGRKNEE